MSIESLATGLSQAKLANDVSFAVQKKVLNSAKAEGQAVLQLLDNAASVGQGGGKSGGGDPLLAAATGQGGLLDTTA